MRLSSVPNHVGELTTLRLRIYFGPSGIIQECPTNYWLRLCGWSAPYCSVGDCGPEGRLYKMTCRVRVRLCVQYQQTKMSIGVDGVRLCLGRR